MSELSYSDFCNHKLFSNFPELLDHPKFEKIIKDFLSIWVIDAHAFYESLLCEYALDLIKENTEEAKQKRDKIFSLIEELIHHENFQVRCVAEVSFIEPLITKLTPRKDIEKYLWPKSLESAREITRQWFTINPLTWEDEKVFKEEAKKAKKARNRF